MRRLHCPTASLPSLPHFVMAPVPHSLGGTSPPAVPAAAALPRDERSIFADEQLQVIVLLFGEFEKNALAFGLLEPLAIFLEELVRSALAANADEQRVPIVH